MRHPVLGWWASLGAYLDDCDLHLYGVCCYALVYCCVEKEAFFYMYKRKVAFQGRAQTLDPLIFSEKQLIVIVVFFCFLPTLDCVDGRTVVYKSQVIYRILPTVNVMVM